VADILGNSPAIVLKHYAKWSQARQKRIDDLMAAAQIKPGVEIPEMPVIGRVM
jgi:hypothetical protein